MHLFPVLTLPYRLTHVNHSDSDEADEHDPENVDSNFGQTAGEDCIHQPDLDDPEQLDFKFQKVGQTVAVYYDTNFHVGSVINITNEQEAEVSFMQKSSLDNKTFMALKNG